MNDLGLNKEKVQAMLTDLESEQIERTSSTTDTDKFAQAICAFSNDLSNSARNGYLLIGVHDNGAPFGLTASDRLLQSLGGLRSDGNILPQPIMSISVFSFDQGDVIVLEIQPSPFPPVRYKGKTWIRVGPRKAVANEMEERILSERRSANVSMFDMRPCLEASLNDMDLDLFRNRYLPNAIDPDLLANDQRDIRDQLAALRFFNTRFEAPTNAGILLFGKNPEYFIPGGYIQYVRFKGIDVTGEILNEKKFSGHLLGLLPRIDAFIDDAIIAQRPVPVSTLKEKTVKNFPNWAIRELMMNAIMHRDYESNAPIKFYHYDDRIEISNAGGLFGKARPENFPNENDYRNPTIAEAMKTMGYVNRFNRGISRVQEELKDNGNPRALFNYHNPGAFAVAVPDALYPAEKQEIAGSPVVLKENTDRVALNTTRETTRETTGETGNATDKETSKEKILRLIEADATITALAMADLMGISEEGIRYHLKNLKKEGILKHTGPTKSGKWVFLK